MSMFLKKIKVTCFIDNLNAGGAQRQICYLANFLKKKNFDVSVLTYHEDNFFKKELKKNKIKYINLQNKNKLIRTIRLIKFLRYSNHDIVIAYLRNPCLIAEISKIFRKKWKLIISERNNYIKENFLNNFLRRFMHLFADHIIVNSNTGFQSIKKSLPFLKKVSVIYNFTNLNYFKPKKFSSVKNEKQINLIGIGKYSEQKNILNLVEALRIVTKKHPNIILNLQWFGDNYKIDQSNEYLNRIRFLINKYNLKNIFKLNPANENILENYQKSTALILPSLYEGFPNAVCEAISCGLPVLVSDVCDNSFFVDQTNGYLFNPNDPFDIAEKIISFSQLENKKKNLMSINSRKKAELIFNKEKYINSHFKIINKLR